MNSVIAGFFLTPAAEKTITQGQNSRKKLSLWEDVPSQMQNSRKKLKLMKFSPQNFQMGSTFYTIFIYKYFQKHKNIEKFAMICQNFKILWKME